MYLIRTPLRSGSQRRHYYPLHWLQINHFRSKEKEEMRVIVHCKWLKFASLLTLFNKTSEFTIHQWNTSLCRLIGILKAQLWNYMNPSQTAVQFFFSAKIFREELMIIFLENSRKLPWKQEYNHYWTKLRQRSYNVIVHVLSEVLSWKHFWGK